MTEGMMTSSEDKSTPEAVEASKKQSQLNLLTLAGVFLLGVVLPPEYKAFAPILFLVPITMAVVKKVRQAGDKLGNTALDQTYTPPMPDQVHSSDPYTYQPKDPKDPRCYKPIG